ncbi:hypothetical protein A9Q99_19505 [Gammaproteobacteria bacterium 45_16_T64]|nr:hypothetical protein A9Q99_19505 [Gammaproteobacteria bacterium 45_16_T64]
MLRKMFIGVALFVMLSTRSMAADLTEIDMCAFTLLGEAGPEYQILEDYRVAAMAWGVKLNLKPYMNEKVVAEELKSGACDIANMTGMQIRHFNKFTGTLDSPGSIPDYDHLKTVLSTLSQPKAAKYMREGEYEIVGIQPAGAIFLFLNDRYLRGISDLAGRRMGVLDSLPEMRQMVADMGMTPVSSTVTNIFQKFNNGVIDVTGGPAIVFDIMELHKGLGDTGAIIEVPLVQANVQLVARADKFPEGFAQKSREYLTKNFDLSIDIIRAAEKAIPRKYWMPVPKCSLEEMAEQTKKVRLAFRDKGIYDGKMLTLLRKVRCNKNPSRAECTSDDAE